MTFQSEKPFSKRLYAEMPFIHQISNINTLMYRKLYSFMWKWAKKISNRFISEMLFLHHNWVKYFFQLSLQRCPFFSRLSVNIIFFHISFWVNALFHRILDNFNRICKKFFISTDYGQRSFFRHSTHSFITCSKKIFSVEFVRYSDCDRKFFHVFCLLQT